MTGRCEIIHLRADRVTRAWWSMEVSSTKHMEGLTDNVETPYSRCILVWTLLVSFFQRRSQNNLLISIMEYDLAMFKVLARSRIPRYSYQHIHLVILNVIEWKTDSTKPFPSGLQIPYRQGILKVLAFSRKNHQRFRGVGNAG